jgi:IclR family acetate operon transcriptional repressor
MASNQSTTARRPRGRPRSAGTENAGGIQSLDRALSVLQALAEQDRVTLSDLALQVGIPTATTYRILSTLQARGFAAFDEATQCWMVGLESYRIGSAYLKHTNLLDVARPIMRALMADSGETANLAIPDDGEVVFVGQIETQNPIRAFFQPGTRTKMHASGTGKAIMAAMPRDRVTGLLARHGLPRFTDTTLVTKAAFFADLDQTQLRGWSFDREERYQGMCCIGSVIFDQRGEATAGVSISGPSARFSEARLPELGSLVNAAAKDITRAIGGYIPSHQGTRAAG